MKKEKLKRPNIKLNEVTHLRFVLMSRGLDKRYEKDFMVTDDFLKLVEKPFIKRELMRVCEEIVDMFMKENI